MIEVAEEYSRITNKVIKGLKARRSIAEAIQFLPVVSAELLADMLKILVGTVRNRLTKAKAQKQIRDAGYLEGVGHLYRVPKRGALSWQKDHAHNLAEAMAALKVCETHIAGLEVEPAEPKEFVTSLGSTKPDFVFWLSQDGRRRFNTWEEDTGSLRGKDAYRERIEILLQWREDFCYGKNPDGTRKPNDWGIGAVTVLFNTRTNKDAARLRETAREVSIKFAKRIDPKTANPKPSGMFYFTSREHWNLKSDPLALLQKPIWLTPLNDTPRSVLG